MGARGGTGSADATGRHHLVSAGEDNNAKVVCRARPPADSQKLWDMRRKKAIYTIPAHNNLISSAKFLPGLGDFIVTASFDTTIKVGALQLHRV